MKNWFYVSSQACGWLFAVPAVIWLCVACYFWVNRIDRQSSWEKATAVVTEICEVQGEESMIKHSRLTFTDPQSGKSVTVNSQVGASGMPVYPVGESVEVLSRLGSQTRLWKIILLSIIWSLSCLLLHLSCLGWFLLSLLSLPRKWKRR